MRVFFLYLSLFSLFLSMGIVESLVVKKEVQMKGNVKEFESFGFAKDGTVQLAVTPLPPSTTSPLYVYICSSDEFAHLITQTDSTGSGIAGNFDICQLAVNYSDPVLELWKVPKKDFYHFLLVKPPSLSRQVLLEYTLLNPGHQHLSLGSHGNPTLYLFIFLLWGLLVTCWGICFFYRSQRVPIHLFLLLLILSKMSVVIVGLVYWTVCHNTGRCFYQIKYLQFTFLVNGYQSYLTFCHVTEVQSFLFAVSEAIFFSVLLLVAKGWRITRPLLPSQEVRTVVMALLLLLATLLFFSFYSESYYFLSLMIMYFFMLPKIFASILRNMKGLETQLSLISQFRLQADTAALLHKMQFFKTFRSSIIVYLGSVLFVNALRIVMVWYLEWFTVAVNELVIFFIVAFITYLLLPANQSLFRSLSSIHPDLPFHEGFYLSDGEVDLGSLGPSWDLDLSNMIVVEFPHQLSPSTIESSASVPIALGLPEKPSESKML